MKALFDQSPDGSVEVRSLGPNYVPQPADDMKVSDPGGRIAQTWTNASNADTDVVCEYCKFKVHGLLYHSSRRGNKTLIVMVHLFL